MRGCVGSVSVIAGGVAITTQRLMTVIIIYSNRHQHGANCDQQHALLTASAGSALRRAREREGRESSERESSESSQKLLKNKSKNKNKNNLNSLLIELSPAAACTAASSFGCW